MAKTREIDTMAQNILRNSIPASWFIREQHPDFYIDYFIEIADRSEPSGIIFCVQLKGTKSPRYSNIYKKISLKTKHLAYYLDNVKQPVLVIAVDVKKKKG